MIVSFDSLNRYEIPKMTLCYANSKYLDLEEDVWDFSIDQSTSPKNGVWKRNTSYAKGATVSYNDRICQSMIPSNIYEPNTTGNVLTRVIGEIVDKDNEELVINFNQTSQLSFRAYRVTTHDDTTENKIAKRVYENLKNRKAIFVEGIGYFIITEVKAPYKDGQYFKDVEATSAEVELQNKMLPYIGEGYDEEGNINAMSGTFAFRDLLTQLLTVTPKWTIGEIDNKVSALYRTFDDISTDENVLAFMLEDMQEAYECVFTFDIINRKVNVYSQSNYVNNTNIHLTKDDLINQLTVEEKSDDIYTVLEVDCDDDLIAFNAINPTGDSRLYDFTYYLDEMSSSLRTKVINFQNRIKDQMVEGRTNNYYYYATQKWQAFNNQMMAQCEVDKCDIQYEMYQKCYANLGSSNSLSKLESDNDEIVAALKEMDAKYAVENTDDYYSSKRIVSMGDIASTRSAIENSVVEIASERTTAQRSVNTYKNQVATWDSRLAGVTTPFKAGNGSWANGYFTEAEFEELSDYISEGRYTDKYVIYTDDMNWVERCEQLMDVYKRAREQMDRVSMPVSELNIDAEDFVFEEKFKEFTDELDVGKFVHIEIENNVSSYPSWSYGTQYYLGDRVRYNEIAYRCILDHTAGSSDTPPNRRQYWIVDEVDIADMFLNQITVNYYDNSLKMKFGTRYSKMDNKSLFEETLGKINKTANSVNYMTGAYELIAGNYNDMADKLQNSRNLTMYDALSSDNQEITIDNYGFTGRKLYTQEGDAINWNTKQYYGTKDGKYDNRQVKLVNNLLVFTSDGWENCDVAIGELKVQQLAKAVDGSGNTDTEERNVYGINAKYIVGDMIIGNGLRIYDNKGRLMFGVNSNEETAGGNIDLMVHGADENGNPITYGLSQTLAGTVFYDGQGKTSVINGDKITTGHIRVVGDGVNLDLGEDGSGLSGRITGQTTIDGGCIEADTINAGEAIFGTLDANKVHIDHLSADYIDAGILHCDTYDGPVNSETHIYSGSGGGYGPVALRGAIDNDWLDIENLYVDDVHLYDELIVYDQKRKYAKNSDGKRILQNSPRVAGRIKFVRGSTDTAETNGVTIIPETSSNSISVTNGGVSMNGGSRFNMNGSNITLTTGKDHYAVALTNCYLSVSGDDNNSGGARSISTTAGINCGTGINVGTNVYAPHGRGTFKEVEAETYIGLPSTDMSSYASKSWVSQNYASKNSYNAVNRSEYVCYNGGTDYVTWTDGMSKYNESDREVKTDINYDNLPDIIDHIRPVTFKYTDRDDDKTHVGVIAQDLVEMLNELNINDYGFVYKFKDGYDEDGIWYKRDSYTVDYKEFTPLLIDKCQKLQKQNNEQQTKIDELEARLARLEAALS